MKLWLKRIAVLLVVLFMFLMMIPWRR